jgi:hypothetical protein
MQMFMLMKDFGGRLGMEAVVHPERTRSSIVTEVRDLISRDQIGVVFVKFIDGNSIEDVTEDIVNEARAQLLEAAE